jgi:t-SNARE complex subunit (syntaxin)
MLHMAVRSLVVALCALSFFQTSFAGYERFWIFSKDANSQVSETWDALSEDEQRALIKRYQNLKEIPEDQSVVLQQRMDWFTQLPEQEKLQMREAWQQMSTAERNEMRVKMSKATTPEQRADIREKYLKKYVQEATSNH